MSVPATVKAPSVETPRVSPSRMRNPRKVPPLMVNATSVLVEKVEAPLATSAVPPRDTVKPPVARVPVVALIRCESPTAATPSGQSPAPVEKARTDLQRAAAVMRRLAENLMLRYLSMVLSASTQCQ
jgi:hypothetical protein